MQIVLIALLYATALSEPSVLSMSNVYSDMESCLKDVVDVEAWLIETAPNEDSYVSVQCIILPKEV